MSEEERRKEIEDAKKRLVGHTITIPDNADIWFNGIYLGKAFLKDEPCKT